MRMAIVNLCKSVALIGKETGMVTAAKTLSQVLSHMTIAFAITYSMTGSMVFGGVAALIEPVINVLLLPFHEKGWAVLRCRAAVQRVPAAALAAQKISQTVLHMSVAFGVMYWASGSVAFGGLAAVLEPICNVIFLPFHDRAWENIRARLQADSHRPLRTA